MSDVESWRPIPGYEGLYDASTHGRIRSHKRWRVPGRVLRGVPMSSGYLKVSLWRDGKQRSALVHRLVLLTFVGPAPAAHEALHLNGDNSNNFLSNLAWGTHSENQFDQVAHGTHSHASKSQCPAGHDYDEKNTYIYPGKPHRGCRKCRRRHMREWHAKKKGAVA